MVVNDGARNEVDRVAISVMADDSTRSVVIVAEPVLDPTSLGRLFSRWTPAAWRPNPQPVVE